MAQITSQCEMMQNAVAAGPIKLKGRFFAVEDGQGEPMIFSIDQNGKLCLIMKDGSGENVLLNLNEKFAVPDDHTITALAATQNRNGKIHLCFAASKGGDASKLYVLQPMGTGLDLWDVPSLDSLCYKGEQWKIQIRDILLGTSNDSTGPETLYPQLFLVFNHIEKDTEDIWALTISTQEKSWTKGTLEMICNPDQIIDMCVGNLRLYRGLFILSKEDTVKLRFVGLDPTEPNAVLAPISQPVPTNASHLASFENKDGKTDLLISGDALTWRSAQDCFSGSKKQTVIADTTASDLLQMVVGQKGNLISVWALNRHHSLSYQEFQLDSNGPPKPLSPSMPLLDNIKGNGRFATLLSPTHGQKIFVVDEANNMKMLEQSVQTALWQPPVDVSLPNSDEMIEFQSHTVQFQLNDKIGLPINGKKLMLCSSSSTELIVNGINIRTSPAGCTIHTDEAGAISIVIRSDGLSVPLLELKDQDIGNSIFPGGSFKIDPMKKLWDTVGSVKSAKDLTDMKMPNGESFVRENVGKDDLEKAAKALKDLSTARIDLLLESNAIQDLKKPANALVSNAKTEIGSMGVQVMQAAGVPADRAWGIWYWICEKIKSGYEWSVQKLKAGWEFAVKIAGKAWNFLLECTSHVASAMQKVLEAITKGWEWVKNKFSFIFTWSDILDVKNIFSNYMVQAILLGADSISDLEEKADQYFADMRMKVQLMKAMKLKLPKELQLLSPNSKGSSDDGDKKSTEAMTSPQAQFGSNHLKQGTTKLPARTKGQTTIERVILRLKKVWDHMKALAERCKVNLIDLFKSPEINLELLLQKVGFDLLEDALGVLQSLVTGLLGSISDLIVELADAITTEIKIPVLSTLYKKISGGHSLTILDLICFCVAIPTTIVYKTVVGKNPADLPGLEELKKPDAHKKELDERMGRLSQDSEATNQSKPSASKSSVSHSFRLPEMKPETFAIRAPIGENNTEEKMVSTTSGFPAEQSFASKSMRLPEMKPSDAKPNSKPQQKFERDNDEQHRIRSRTRFAESSHWASPLMKLGAAVGGYAWFGAITYPTLHIPPAPWEFYSVAFSFLGKAIIWLLQGCSLAKWNLPPDYGELFKDRWFVANLKIWGLGGISVFGQLFGKAAAYSFEMIGAVAQMLQLAQLHIESWSGDVGYSIYLAIEEWTKVLGKLVAPISGYTVNAYFTAEIALVLNTSGALMTINRVCLEQEDSRRKILFSGMDIG